jgi:hypothetical protein
VHLTFYAGRKFIKSQIWLENNGRHGYASRDKKWHPEWFAFDGLALELGLGLGEKITATCEGVSADNSQPFSVTQYVKPMLFHYDHFEYVIRRGGPAVPPPIKPRTRGEPGERKKNEADLKVGVRTDGTVQLSGPQGRLNVGVRYFWQNYEKAIELEGQILRVWLWPTMGQWPRKHYDRNMPGYVSAQLGPLVKEDLYNLPGGVHKGHELILDFSGAAADLTHARVATPLRALPGADYIASTRAAVGIIAPPEARCDDSEADFKLASWNRMARSAADPESQSSIFHARTGGSNPGCFWYGWMDFGDLPIPKRGAPQPVSLQHDWPWVMLINYLRFGDPKFLELATPMARHLSDVDQSWSGDREEVAAARDLQRPTNTTRDFHAARFTHSHPDVGSNWIAGLVQYYCITGEPKVLDAIRVNERGMRNAWQWLMANRKDYYVARRVGDVGDIANTVFNYVALFDLTGDPRYLDDAMTLFRNLVLPVWKSKGPHLHNPAAQIGGQSYAKNDIKYCHSIQAWVELHHRTGDKQIFKLLEEGAKKEWKQSHFDAPIFLAGLRAYVALHTKDEDLIDQALDDFIAGYPESKSPPVFMKGNSRWAANAAIMLRTGHIFQYSFWQMDKPKK